MRPDRYKQDANEITRSTGVSDVNDLAQVCVAVPPSRPLGPLTLALTPPARPPAAT